MKKTILTLLLSSFYVITMAQGQWSWFLDSKYEAVGDFTNGLINVKEKGKWGYLNQQKKWMIPATYDLALPFSEGLAVVSKGKKMGMIDKTNKTMIPLIYHDLRPLQSGVALFFTKPTDPNNLYSKYFGYINKEGNVIIPFKGNVISPATNYGASEGMIGKYGDFYNTKGEKVISQPNGSIAYIFSEGIGVVMNAYSKWGFVDKKGKVLIPFQYDEANGEGFREGLCAVAQKGKYFFIDKKGKKVFPLLLDAVGSFSEGLAAVKIRGKWGFINKIGQVVIEPQFEGFVAPVFSEGWAAIKQNGKWGFINKGGQLVVKAIFEQTGKFTGGKCRVKFKGKWGVIQQN